MEVSIILIDVGFCQSGVVPPDQFNYLVRLRIPHHGAKWHAYCCIYPHRQAVLFSLTARAFGALRWIVMPFVIGQLLTEGST